MKINEERRTKQVEALSYVLMRLCERNNRCIISTTPVTRFYALRPPQITIKDYLKRIAKFSHCSEECFVLALIYIDRLILSNRTFSVNIYNVHRLVISSVMLAAKFFDDQYFNNAHYARVGGVSCKEMNQLEIEFLFMMNFDLFVDNELYTTYDKCLLIHRRGRQSFQQNNVNTVCVSNEPCVSVVRSRQSQQVKGLAKHTPSTKSAGVAVPVKTACSQLDDSTQATKNRVQRVLQRSNPLQSTGLPKLRYHPIPRCSQPSYPIKILRARERIHSH